MIKLVRNHPHNTTTLWEFLWTKNEGSDKTSSKGPSTKYDHFMRVSMDKDEENDYGKKWKKG